MLVYPKLIVNQSASRHSLSGTVSPGAQQENSIQSPRGSLGDRNLHDECEQSQTEPFPSLPQTPVSQAGRQEPMNTSWPSLKRPGDNMGSPGPPDSFQQDKSTDN